MFLSKYTICVNDFPSQDESLLYHTRTQALVKISRKLRDVLDHYGHPKFFKERMRYAEELDRLAEMGFLVGSHEEDALSPNSDLEARQKDKKEV
ncbi:MAG: hypothetical protein AB1650_00935 [Candidatus Omnitrophota bacterium]